MEGKPPVLPGLNFFESPQSRKSCKPSSLGDSGYGSGDDLIRNVDVGGPKLGAFNASLNVPIAAEEAGVNDLDEVDEKTNDERQTEFDTDLETDIEFFDADSQSGPTLEEAIAQIPRLMDTKELVEFWLYPCETHTVNTPDNYYLTLYRIPNPQHGSTLYTHPLPTPRPPVILWHGLMIHSNAFVCSPGGPKANLALVLADAGFDVWLANSRGTVHSRTHSCYDATKYFQTAYWDSVGMDEMAQLDVPAVVKFVCERTGWNKVGYIGYSQGTAQMFMSLSLSAEMNERVAAFVALAPAITPKQLANRTLTTITNISPELMYGLGFWSFLPAAETLRRILSPEYYARVIHMSLNVLTRWKCDRWNQEWRPALYSHLYGGGSVRNVVHWFEIITSKRFKAHRHHLPSTITNTLPFRPAYTKPPTYPLQHITTRMHLFCGEKDDISDPALFRKVLPPGTNIEVIEGYEHMDFLWDPTAGERCWEDVIRVLREAMGIV